MNNFEIKFNSEYDNNENKEIIKKLLSNEDGGNMYIYNFDAYLSQRISTNYTTLTAYLPSYYIEIYTDFLYFNYYYEKQLNWTPVPVYSPNVVIQNILNQIPPLKTEVIFYALNYNIGQFTSLDDWKKHCNDVKSTLAFLDNNKMKVVIQVTNLKEDIELLNEVIEKFFLIKDKKVPTMEDFKNFEDKLNKIELKNRVYTNNMIYSIKGNIEYLNKYINAMRKEYKDIDNKIKEFSQLKNDFYELQEDSKKTKDFYLTTSGAMVALISIISGNISMVQQNIMKYHILLFNASILSAILIFSILFNAIYNSNQRETYSKKLVHIVIVIFSIVICLLFYA
ncbi:hypothetical protein LDJ98_06595 [Fusobacterium nucleatum]|uniref:hypothetical protein n=1 Tax=Fusobacterium nucleatum TaxID=851 RepID=UPI0030CE451D